MTKEEMNKNTLNTNKQIKYTVYKTELVDNKPVCKAYEKFTTHSPRYEHYKQYMIDMGANEELFNMPAINNIIDYIIENGRASIMGKSPIMYKEPNQDGSFDIIGRMDGSTKKLIFKMKYCEENDNNHYIELDEYEEKLKKHNEELDSHDGIQCKKYYLNKSGIIIDESMETIIPEFDEDDKNRKDNNIKRIYKLKNN